MVGWSARRRALYVLAFTGFTIIGLLVFNVYPTLLNTYTSFTNRNKFHPYPDCTNTLNNIVVPYCWESVFDIPKAGIPFTFVDPIFENYAKITGGIFSVKGLTDLFLLVACIIPLLVVYQIDKREDRKLERKIPAWLLWTIGLVLAFLILALFGLNAWKELTTSGDFWAVVFRTMAFVILRVPFTFILGLLGLDRHQPWPAGEEHLAGDFVHSLGGILGRDPDIIGVEVLFPGTRHHQPDSGHVIQCQRSGLAE